MKREWIPAAYEDEMVPPLRPSPSDWVEKAGGKSHQLAANSICSTSKPMPLTDGQLVEFSWTEDHGGTQLTINADGTWSCPVEEPKAFENGVMRVVNCDDWDSMMIGLKDFAEAVIQMDPDAREVDIRFICWSSNAEPFVFRDGKFYPKPDREELIKGIAAALMRRGYQSADNARSYAEYLFDHELKRLDDDEDALLCSDPVKIVADDAQTWTA